MLSERYRTAIAIWKRLAVEIRLSARTYKAGAGVVDTIIDRTKPVSIVNAKNHVNGRKITFISYDDGYSGGNVAEGLSGHAGNLLHAAPSNRGAITKSAEQAE